VKLNLEKNRLKYVDTTGAIVACLIGILTYNENEEYYSEEIDSDGNILKARNESTSTTDSLRITVIVLTFFLGKVLINLSDVLIVLHYVFMLRKMKL
jgi:hypothetical protein